ncbi:MAG: phosphatase PAP2 family protein [bacterium]|nr:phosphatase PAP2 family protein [bacterium]
MLEFLAGIDQAVFVFINSQLANPVTDWLMPIITSNNLLRLLYGLALLLMLLFGNSRVRWLCLFSALVLLLTDQTSASLIKPLIGRLRPCHTLPDVHLLVDCGGGKAMPSSHAANAFGLAALFSLALPRTRVYLLIFAALVALSRIFVGVHYPADIVVGGVVGCLFGYLVWILFARVENRLPGIRNRVRT